MNNREPESDGEIEDDADYDEISSQEEDFFAKLKHEINKTKSRKAELELENSFANYEHKENVTHNNDKWRSRRLAAVKRSPIKRLRRDSYNNRASNGLRAASVFSNRSSVKRRRPDRIRKRRPKVNNINSSKPPTPVIQIDDEDDQGDESNDDELLELRLMALKTKLERIDNDQHQVETREEEELRIQALKSAVFKNRDEIREKMRKKKQKDEQRPYSPSDQPFLDDEDMVLSPVESPQVECHDEIDMDISNSNSPAEELKELSDMDIVESPQSLGSDENSREVDEDEIALRAQLLTSMAKKKQEETVQAKKKEAEKKQLTENLKLAVQRIKQQKRPKETEPTPSEHLLASALERIRSKLVQSNNMDQKKLEEVMRIENTKLQTNVEVFQPIEPIVEESVELDKSKEAATALMATITDTKNIPLINEGRSTKKSRLITSLDAVMRPVAKLIITVNNDSDTDDYDECRFSRRTVKRTVKRTVSGCEKRELKNVEFESRLDNFLRNIRQQQEELSVNVPSSATSATNSASSAVKHLPPSSQKEYEKLIAKMKFLEAEKRKRMRARQLKRTKSNSQTISTSTEPTASALTAPTPTTVAKRSPDKPKMCQTATVIKPQATPTKTSDDKISNTLMKISLLDQEAQQRLMIKTESNFRTHSESLCQAASESVKILEANAADMKRQERITTEIAELEKQLKRYKSSLNVLNKKIRGSVGRFIQSQRELLQSRTRQKGFEQRICIPFGKMLKGPDYKTPEMTEQNKELHENYRIILDQVEQLEQNANFAADATIMNNFKVISERLKKLIPAETAAENSNANLVESTKEETVQNDDQVTRTAITEPPKAVNNNDSLDVRFTYDSPLEMMRSNKTKVDSVDKVLCPFQLGGMCDDKKCTMLHI